MLQRGTENLSGAGDTLLHTDSHDPPNFTTTLKSQINKKIGKTLDAEPSVLNTCGPVVCTKEGTLSCSGNLCSELE